MRWLTIISFAFAFGIFVSHYFLNTSVITGFILILAIALICGVIILRNKKCFVPLLMCVFAFLGILRYDVHSNQFIGIEEGLTESKYRITAYVVECPAEYSNYAKLTVKLKTDLLPEVKTVLYDYEGYLKKHEDLKPGQMIRTTVRFSSAFSVSGEETDNYISKGIYLRGYLTDEITCYENKFYELLYFPLRLGENIRSILDTYLSHDTAVFMKALITGDKTGLYESPELYNNISKAGIAHVIAVSGMHVSFVVAFAMFVFGNRWGWITTMFMIAVFVIMTGVSPSVVRAAFMQTLYLIAPVFKRESDGLTSISFALLILLLINPFSIASVSLQLSFAAVLGIIIVTPKCMEWFLVRKYKVHRCVLKLYVFVASSVSTSFGALIFTIPISAYYFGSISVFAPITNLLVLWIVPFCFVLGLILCILSIISTSAAICLGGLLSLMIQFIYRVSEIISGVHGSYVYLPENIMMIWVVFVGVILFTSVMFKNNRYFNPIIAICISILSLYGLSYGVKQYYSIGTTVAAVDVGQGQSIVILNEETTLMVDCGGSSNSGENTAKWLETRGRTCVDELIITHFDTDHVNGIIDLITLVPINEIKYSTLGMGEYESGLLKEILYYADMYDVETTIINKTTNSNAGNIRLDYMFQRKAGTILGLWF